MADDFVRGYDCRCGVGGRKCHCCNDFKGKDKKKLTRTVRRTLKDKVKKDIDKEINI
jgi:hypothetical protein